MSPPSISQGGTTVILEEDNSLCSVVPRTFRILGKHPPNAGSPSLVPATPNSPETPLRGSSTSDREPLPRSRVRNLKT